MKIVIAGSTGYLGQELVKQALSNPKITTVIGLSRRETQPPSQEELYPQSDISKLRSVIVKDLNSDWGKDENVKKELDGVDAAIWYASSHLTLSDTDFEKIGQLQSRLPKHKPVHGTKSRKSVVTMQ